MDEFVEISENDDFLLVETENQEDKLSFHEEDGFIFINPARVNNEELINSKYFLSLSTKQRTKLIDDALQNYVFCASSCKWSPKYKKKVQPIRPSLNNLCTIKNFIKVMNSKDLVLPPQKDVFTLFEIPFEHLMINGKNKKDKIARKMKALDNRSFKKKPLHNNKFIPKQVHHHNMDYNRHGRRNN